MRELLYVAVLSLGTWVMVWGCRDDTISGTGTVHFLDLEGGFYGILGEHGEHYDPVNLGKDFQVEGLRVRFEAKRLKEMVSLRMWGTLIEIIRIEKL